MLVARRGNWARPAAPPTSRTRARLPRPRGGPLPTRPRRRGRARRRAPAGNHLLRNSGPGGPGAQGTRG
eukprot:5697056-Lingulodinium_polyedra.AAC.1